MNDECQALPFADDLATWCDYARGLTDAELTARLDALRHESPDADRIARLFTLVAEVGRADCRNEISEDTRRIVRALGSLRPQPTEPEVEGWRRWRRLPFEVIFDNSLAPATAGVRDLQPPHPSQRVYEAADLVIEVRHEGAYGDGSVVVGQIVRLHPPARPVIDLPILLMADDLVVARTRSGPFGEFFCDSLPATALRLCLVLEDETLLELPLGDPGQEEE